MTSTRRFLARLIAGAVLAVGLSVAAAGSASAHDVLISSSPTDGATVQVMPRSVTFDFDQPVQNYNPVVALIGPDGKHYETGTAQVSGNTVTGSVGSGPAGAYIASYRIVSADGHPVTGEVHFTLAVGSAPVSGSAGSGPAAGPASVVAVPSTAPAPVTAPVTAKSGLSAPIWIGLIVAALVIAAAAVILLRRPSGPKSVDKDY